MSVLTQDLGDKILAKAKGAVTAASMAFGELNIEARADKIVSVLTLLRDDKDFQFQQLIELCGVDYPQRPLRHQMA